MRKSFKKGMAMLLAAAMVFSTPVALEKTTAKAAADPTPVIGLDFEDGVTEGTSYTEGGFAFDVTGGAKVVANPDDAQDKVLALTPDSDGSTTGTQYITTKADALKNLDFSKGFSISMALKPTKQKTDWNYLFSAGSLDVDGNKTERWLDGTIGFIARYAATYKANFPGDGWVSGNPVGSNFQYFTAGDGVNKWTNLTYVYGEDNVSVYVDGLLTNQWKSEAAIKTILGQLNAGKLSIGGGIDPTLEHFTGYVDDVNVYNSALNASQVYKAATGQDAVADGLLGDISAELDEEGKKIDLKYNTKMSIPADDLSISVNGEVVATGSAVSAIPVSGAGAYAYTPDKDGEYKLAVSAKEQTLNGKLYLAQEKTVSITVVKEGDRFYVNDDTLFTGFGVTKTTTDKVFKVNWTPAAGVTATATVKGPDGKAVGNPLTAPGNVTVSAAGEYTVDIVAKKGNSIKKDTAKFTYKAASTPAPGKTDKFSKITTKPLYKYTFDDAKEVTLSAKAKVEGGVLKLAPTAGKHGEYYAKIDSMTADDFSKGITFIADVNVAAVGKNSTGAYQDWTPFVIFGDGTPAKKDAAGATYRWAITQGFSSKAGTSKDYHAAGYYGNEIKAPYTWDYFNTAANRGKWYTIAVTVKKNEMITYINGVQVQKGTADYSVILDGMKKSNNNYLGASYWDADDDFAGSMDDVAVYNTALSAADVKTLNRSGTGGTGTVTPPTGGTDTAKVSKVSITVPNRKAGKTVYMKKGDKVTLKATVKGSGKYSKSVTWKTSKKSVATVSSKGKVTAKKAGTAKITATSKTDKSKKATITIKVSKKAVKNKTLKISPTKKTLKKGKSLTIKIKKITKKTTDKITYKSSKKSVATVDAYGKVKAKKKGKATITVKCGKKSAKLKLTVKK